MLEVIMQSTFLVACTLHVLAMISLIASRYNLGLALINYILVDMAIALHFIGSQYLAIVMVLIAFAFNIVFFTNREREA